MRRSLTIAAFAALILHSGVPRVHAQGTSGTLLSDLWGNPAEPGWGVTVQHQSDVIFLTFFIYRADGSPYWVTGTLTRITPGSGITFPMNFSGVINETRGSPFNAPFNAAQGALRDAGTAVFSATSATQATLVYTIDGTTVSKNVERETLRLLSFDGNYLGGVAYTTSNCSPSALNGQLVNEPGLLTITQSGNSLSMSAQSGSGTCTFTSRYSQAGQVGSAAGTFSCTNGSAGSFTLSAMQWTAYGMSAALAGRNQSCQLDGFLGGITGTHLLP